MTLIFGVLGGGLYLLYLNHTVQVKFEGKRWAVPARVYGRALELYPGAGLGPDSMVRELERLGYRKLSHARQEGSYARNRSRLHVHTRPFAFWDGKEPARFLDLQFQGERLASLTDGDGRAISLVRLEPPAVGSIYPSHNEDRVLVKRDEIPELLVKALLAVEDRAFFTHSGLHYKGIARALWANLRAGGVVQGGSTLTQQLVKNFFLTQERSLQRKVNEAMMALLLEHHYGKDEILEAYANEIYLGQDGQRAIHGFGLASQFYFNRPLGELELPQLALLAGLVKGPSYYNPRRHKARAKERRDLVLRLMAEQGFITDAQAKKAQGAGLGVTHTKGHGRGGYPAFMELVRKQLHRDYREEDLTSEGLRIFTTLDPWVQAQAEESLAQRLTTLEKEKGLPAGTLEAATVVANAVDGEVLAVVGGRKASFAGFNRALDAVRPIGSLVKPVVYLSALMQPSRYSLITPLEDKPLRVTGAGGKQWSPQNYDKRSHGVVPLQDGLVYSYNLATVALGMELGLGRVADTLHNLGIRREVDVYPSLLLGAVSLSPLEVTQLYQTLAAGGFYSPLRAIREVMTAENKPLQRYPLTVHEAAPAGPVYLLNQALQDVVKRGTGRSLAGYLSPALNTAGKTGTTDDLRDSWFAGFTGDKVAVVWVGRDDNKPAGLSGASGALRVWGDMMRRLQPLPLDLPQP
jgi:penicillin-binding protein 1B